MRGILMKRLQNLPGQSNSTTVFIELQSTVTVQRVSLWGTQNSSSGPVLKKKEERVVCSEVFLLNLCLQNASL